MQYNNEMVDKLYISLLATSIARKIRNALLNK